MTSIEQIRAAVSSGEYPKAQQLWEDYVRQLAAGPVAAADLAQLSELKEWTRCVVLAAHTHAADELRTSRANLHVLEAYGAPPASPHFRAKG